MSLAVAILQIILLAIVARSFALPHGVRVSHGIEHATIKVLEERGLAADRPSLQASSIDGSDERPRHHYSGLFQ